MVLSEVNQDVEVGNEELKLDHGTHQEGEIRVDYCDNLSDTDSEDEWDKPTKDEEGGREGGRREGEKGDGGRIDERRLMCEVIVGTSCVLIPSSLLPFLHPSLSLLPSVPTFSPPP